MEQIARLLCQERRIDREGLGCRVKGSETGLERRLLVQCLYLVVGWRMVETRLEESTSEIAKSVSS